MRIDWVTLIAQLVNFAILVVLLKRFLYGRIVAAIDRREHDIAERIAEAERSRAEADGEAKSLASARRQLTEQKASMLSAAEQEAEHRLESLTLEARQQVAKTEARWRSSVDRQKQKFLSDLRSRTGEQIYETARVVLRDLADTELESRIVAVLERKLGELSEADRKLLVDAAGRSGAVVRSVFAMSGTDAKQLENTIREVIGDAPLRFETAEDLVCGIELTAGERSVSWNVSGYIDGIERELGVLIEREARAPGLSEGAGSAPEHDASEAAGSAPEHDASEGAGSDPEPTASEGAGSAPEPAASEGAGSAQEHAASEGAASAVDHDTSEPAGSAEHDASEPAGSANDHDVEVGPAKVESTS